MNLLTKLGIHSKKNHSYEEAKLTNPMQNTPKIILKMSGTIERTPNDDFINLNTKI